MICTSLRLLLWAIGSLYLQQAATAAGTVYNVPPNSLAPLFDGIYYQVPAGVRVNVTAAAPVASANFNVAGGELYYNAPEVSTPGPFGIGVSNGGYVEFAAGLTDNLYVTAGGSGKVLDGIIPYTLVNDGQLDILGVQHMWLLLLQGNSNLSGGRVQVLDLGDVGAEPPTSGPAILNQTGGVLGEEFFRIYKGGVANISGGSFGPTSSVGSIAAVAAGGVVNLIVASMEIDGTPLSGLSPDATVELLDRNVNVTGVLASGDPFAFRVGTDFDFGTLVMEPGGKLLITLAIPEPTAVSLMGILMIGAVLGRRRRA
jgi:hypothetical protein